MQAIVIDEWGGPEVLRVRSVRDPEPAGDEVIVELRASSVNWHDVLVRRTGRGFPLPSIPGMDGAGVCRGTGEEVVLHPALSWGARREAPGADFAFLGDRRDGTYAELVSVPRQALFPKPKGLSWTEAAALPTAGITAYRALFTRAQLRPGETVLVLGAASGVSTFAVSLAAAHGAKVLVTSSNVAKIDRAVELGAEGGTLYTSEDWVEEIKELSQGGVDVVVDGVGSNLGDSLACARPGGRVAVFGASGASSANVDVPKLYFGQHSILGTTLGDAQDFAEFLAAVERGNLRPAIDGVWKLGDARYAHERMEAREHFGKIVMNHDD